MPRSLLLALAVVVAAALALVPPSAAQPVVHPGATEGSAAAWSAGDCVRCHEVPALEAAPRLDNCTTCHLWIRSVAADPNKRAKAAQVFPLWERYERNVASYLQMPSMAAAMARLEPSWVARYLADPHDLRPGLPETMPRFSLSSQQIDAIQADFAAATVSVPARAAPSPERVASGEALFTEKGCIACHAFGAAETPPVPHVAPDLAHARDRLSPDMAVAWILDPKAISPDASMVSLGLTEDEALAVRDYLWLAEPGWTDATPLGPAPVAAARPVAWPELEEKVFGKICVHCHMDPAQNQGRAGPGNDGGFGFAATGIELQTYEGVVAVADKLPRVLLERREEAHRDVVSYGERPVALERPERPGMPLGLPPIPDDDIALVLAWIDQGMPAE